MTNKAFEKLLHQIEQATLDKAPIRSFQLKPSIVRKILTHYKLRLIENMKSNHPQIYCVFQNNHQAVKLPNKRTIFELSLSEKKLSKIDRLSLNHQTNRIIYHLDLLIKTPDRYATLFDLYQRTKTTSFGGAINQITLNKLENTLVSQLQQFDYYYQQIIDGMNEIEHLRHPKPRPRHQNPKRESLFNTKPISDKAHYLFKHLNDKSDQPTTFHLNKRLQISSITTDDIHGVIQLHQEHIQYEMKSKYPEIYTIYQSNHYSFTTPYGAGNIFHQMLFNQRLNQNVLPSKEEHLLNQYIQQVLSGMTALTQITKQYSRFADMYERIKHTDEIAKDDSLAELEKKLSTTLLQSKEITTEIKKNLQQIDTLNQQFKEQHVATPPKNHPLQHSSFKNKLTHIKDEHIKHSSHKPKLKS